MKVLVYMMKNSLHSLLLRAEANGRIFSIVKSNALVNEEFLNAICTIVASPSTAFEASERHCILVKGSRRVDMNLAMFELSCIFESFVRVLV